MSNYPSALKNLKTVEPEHKFSPEELLDFASREQDGDAALFVATHRERFLFDHAAGRWFTWAGNYWKEDRLQEALAAVEAIADYYVPEACRWAKRKTEAEIAGSEKEAKDAEAIRKMFMRKISCLRKVAWKRGVLQLAAAGENKLSITGEEWDRDPWTLPCLNGVVNLKDGSFRPGRPGDLIKTVCPTEWKGLDQPANAWEHFQRTITDDENLPDFKRRLYGASIPGDVTERTLAIFEGPKGQNGKGTELETIHAVLGPLAGPIPAELLLQQDHTRSPDAPSPSLMALRGKRIVWASETERGRAFNTQKCKWLTGGDTLTGRDPHGVRQVQFMPTHSVFLITNNKPRVPSSDHAFWLRVCLISYPFSFIDSPTEPNQRQKDPDLPNKLRAEAPGILAWLVKGCLEWQKNGLNPPDSVLQHKRQYQAEEDQLGRFLTERCVLDPDKSAQSGKLYTAYKTWCVAVGEKAMRTNEFGDEMRERFGNPPPGRLVYYQGIALAET